MSFTLPTDSVWTSVAATAGRCPLVEKGQGAGGRQGELLFTKLDIVFPILDHLELLAGFQKEIKRPPRSEIVLNI